MPIETRISMCYKTKQKKRYILAAFLLRHEVVRLDGRVDILAVDADGNAHQHVLRTLHDFGVDLEQIRTLKRLMITEMFG
jgi:hypothetical protein